ncbi:sigma-70 family RNA polymerase sigma factor [Luteolibacter ambystomatis]|uniref:Sigma-70 family RNA polymerase sigma factor n=1 Tax=Luteolibacter ambystomatis TaxID=2824561 RepID=A0A975J2R8_9BACT|nr:sigma-70 family RNA polymerase sigma factor [Luteolibacter ambystomatis]QUE52924.1 sigma-70 family RNA polymerase sigma factor [Luteolibacter ambystomatis]
MSDGTASRNHDLHPPALSESLETSLFALRPRLAAYLRAMLPDHHAVDDCLQETFLLIFDRYQDVPNTELPALAFVCARNKARAWLDKQKTGRLVIIDPEVLHQIAEKAAAATTAEAPGHRVMILRNCLGTLSAEQRELVECRYGGNSIESLEEFAIRRNRRMDAIYKQLERIRGFLKKCVTSRL